MTDDRRAKAEARAKEWLDTRVLLPDGQDDLGSLTDLILSVQEEMKVAAAEHALLKGVEALDAAYKRGREEERESPEVLVPYSRLDERNAEVKRVVREVLSAPYPSEYNVSRDEILRRLGLDG